MKMAFIINDSGCTKIVVDFTLLVKFAHAPFHDAERECFHSLTVAVTLWAWWAMSGSHAVLWSSRAFNFIFLLR